MTVGIFDDAASVHGGSDANHARAMDSAFSAAAARFNEGAFDAAFTAYRSIYLDLALREASKTPDVNQEAEKTRLCEAMSSAARCLLRQAPAASLSEAAIADVLRKLLHEDNVAEVAAAAGPLAPGAAGRVVLKGLLQELVAREHNFDAERIAVELLAWLPAVGGGVAEQRPAPSLLATDDAVGEYTGRLFPEAATTDASWVDAYPATLSQPVLALLCQSLLRRAQHRTGWGRRDGTLLDLEAAARTGVRACEARAAEAVAGGASPADAEGERPVFLSRLAGALALQSRLADAVPVLERQVAACQVVVRAGRNHAGVVSEDDLRGAEAGLLAVLKALGREEDALRFQATRLTTGAPMVMA